MITFEPIGHLETPFSSPEEVPKGPGTVHTAEGTLVLRPELEAGLADIEGFSHLFVIWVFHLVDGERLTVTPPTDTRPHGIFATRAPFRPNPIGLSVVRLLGRDGARLRLGGVDMVNGSPVLDVKPYTSSVPVEVLRRGWMDAARER